MTLNIDVKEANHHRHVNDIFKMIDDSTLPERVKYRSKKILKSLVKQKLKFMACRLKKFTFMKWGNGLYYRYYWWVYCTRTTRD